MINLSKVEMSGGADHEGAASSLCAVVALFPIFCSPMIYADVMSSIMRGGGTLAAQPNGGCYTVPLFGTIRPMTMLSQNESFCHSSCMHPNTDQQVTMSITT